MIVLVVVVMAVVKVVKTVPAMHFSRARYSLSLLKMSVCCWMPAAAAAATRCHKFLNRLSVFLEALPPQTRLHYNSPTKFEVLPVFCYNLSQFSFSPLILQSIPSLFQVQSGRRKNRATKSTKSLQAFFVISKSSQAADEDDDAAAAAAPFIGSSDTTPFSLSRDFTLHLRVHDLQLKS